MFKKILIPLDGSDLSARAVPVAYALAGPDTQLALLRSVEPVRAGTAENIYRAELLWPDEAQQPDQAAASYLKMVRASVPADLRVDSYVTEGDAAGAIVDTARDIQADLIVMSSHGYSGLTRWMLGSVAERVLRAAPCSVLMVRGTPRFKHVLVTLDGSLLAEQALAPALCVAAAFHSQITLLRAVSSISAEAMHRLDEKEMGLGEQLVQGQLADAEAYLCRLAAANGAARRAYKVAVPSDHAADAIAYYAGAHDVDLIVMATHGHTGLQRWMLGSVTEKVTRANGWSMLVTRPQPIDHQTGA
ncbi:MAG: universal stress protein [Anaerolineales bacterium]